MPRAAASFSMKARCTAEFETAVTALRILVLEPAPIIDFGPNEIRAFEQALEAPSGLGLAEKSWRTTNVSCDNTWR